jgi:peptidoglycan/LPS O-acetylase OafA/YrhL
MTGISHASGYRADIDGLRALAVLPVVFGHAGFPGFSGGFVGVDIFFVISGFLITGILLREVEAGQLSILRFYERRARRILPALGNQFVYVLKMSSLVSVIGMQELTRRANELVVTEYRPLEIYTVLVLEYLALVLLVSAGVRWLERRMGRE